MSPHLGVLYEGMGPKSQQPSGKGGVDIIWAVSQMRAHGIWVCGCYPLNFRAGIIPGWVALPSFSYLGFVPTKDFLEPSVDSPKNCFCFSLVLEALYKARVRDSSLLNSSHVLTI